MDYAEIYAKFLRRFLKLKAPLRVVFDCSNGTTALIIKKLRNLEIDKLEIKLINDKPDGNFPAHGPNPMAENALNDLERAVKKYRTDLGVIFDADGDRVFFVDDKGKEIHSDIIAGLIAENFFGPVILDIRSGYSAREPLSRAKRKVVDSRVGHYFIKKMMKNKKINFAAELSGHYYFRDFFYCDSGIFAAIQALNQASDIKQKGSSLSRYADSLPGYFSSGEINFRVENKQSLLKKIESRYKKQAKKISHLDGVKMEFDDWWFNLRPSNTEDVLRLNLQAKREGVYKSKLKEVKKLLLTNY